MDLMVLLTGIMLAAAVILLFGFTIFVHELGHFLAARACGMVVDVFSIGFGHAIWKKRVNGILYKVGWIPLGGYVALPQMEPPSEERRDRLADAQKEAAEDGSGEGEFAEDLPVAAPWKKIVVAVSGAVGNILFAIVLAWIIYLSPNAKTGGSSELGIVKPDSEAYSKGLRRGDRVLAVNGNRISSWYEYYVECHLGAGKSESVTLEVDTQAGIRSVALATFTHEIGHTTIPGLDEINTLVDRVTVDFPAYVAGIRPGDVIYSADGKSVFMRADLVEIIGERPGEEVVIRVRRQGEFLDFPIVPRFNEEAGHAVIGVLLVAYSDIVPMWMIYKRPWRQLSSDATAIFRLLRALTTREESKAAAKGLGSPVAIVYMMWIAFQMSFPVAIGFIRFLNINLAVLNLLPIPVLDGGHVMFALYETVTRRQPNARFVHSLINVFAVLLIGMILLLVYKDIKMFSKISRLRKERAGTNLTVQVESEPEAVGATP